MQKMYSNTTGAEVVYVYCRYCCKTHTVSPYEAPCAPECWYYEPDGGKFIQKVRADVSD